MAVSHGAALAITKEVTVQDFLRRGAAIGCRVVPHHCLNVLLSNFDIVNPLSQSASMT